MVTSPIYRETYEQQTNSQSSAVSSQAPEVGLQQPVGI
jgi:hypothetical protein